VLEKTTVKAKTDTVMPTSDSLTFRLALISGRSPVGSISVVTLRKIAIATVMRAKYGKRGEAVEVRGAVIDRKSKSSNGGSSRRPRDAPAPEASVQE
jgi:hypothetical protein